MKRKISILLFVSIAFILFVIIGFPLLRGLKANLNSDRNNENSGTGDDIIVSKTKIIDLSVETQCKDPVTSEIDLVCQTPAGCDQICFSKGCKDFGLTYNGTDFSDNKCKCICNNDGLLKNSIRNLQNDG